MKNVLATGITSSSQQPYTKKTHEWYNSMVSEAAEALVKSLIPSSAHTGKLVILNGCELTGTNPSLRTIDEGWVWYDGEIFRVEASEFTTNGLEIGIWSISTNADNLIFSDGASKPVTQERTFVMSNGLSGSGLFDEGSSNVLVLNKKTKVIANQDPVTGITTSTSLQPVVLTLLEEDTKSEYDISNGRFTPKQAGWYMLHASSSILAISGGALGGVVSIGWQENGSGKISGFFSTVVSAYSSYVGCMSSTIKYFNGSSDYVRLIYHQSEVYVVGLAASMSITLYEADLSE